MHFSKKFFALVFGVSILANFAMKASVDSFLTKDMGGSGLGAFALVGLGYGGFNMYYKGWQATNVDKAYFSISSLLSLAAVVYGVSRGRFIVNDLGNSVEKFTICTIGCSVLALGYHFLIKTEEQRD